MSEETQKAEKTTSSGAVVAIIVSLGMMYGEQKLANLLGIHLPDGLLIFIVVLVAHLMLVAVIYYKIDHWLSAPSELSQAERPVETVKEPEIDTSDIDNAPVWVMMLSYLLLYSHTNQPFGRRQKNKIGSFLQSAGMYSTMQETNQCLSLAERIVANHTVDEMENILLSRLQDFSYNETRDSKRWVFVCIKQVMMVAQGGLQPKNIQALNTLGKAVRLNVGDVQELIQQSSEEDFQLLGLTTSHEKIDDSPQPSTDKPKEEKLKKHRKATVDDAIKELNQLIGLKEVKEEINSLVNYIKIARQRKAMGQSVPHISYHCVFTGNPGTGKTTVARILAKIYAQLGIIGEPKLIEVSRADLVGGYLGQTAIKTTEMIEKAMDGVLFIDEAYTLSIGQDSYGQEAIDTLLKQMEDHRERLIVIIAGYTDEMEQFLATNPGLKSRFTRFFEFSDYNTEELMQIFQSVLKKYDFSLSPEAESVAHELFETKINHKERTFGNARYVRNLFEKTLVAQSDRLARESGHTQLDLSTILPQDLQVAVSKMA